MISTSSFLLSPCNIDAMVNPQYPFKGQQVLTLIGPEQTISSLMVMIYSVIE